jgi:L,D-peptidoglycan transpeptidase YkuD (ErfK/YbiS/YcfS/YnhG family)
MKTKIMAIGLLFSATMLAAGCGSDRRPDPVTESLIGEYSDSLGDVGQLVVVKGESLSSSFGTVTALEKKDGSWTVVQGPDSARVGRNGMTPESKKVEGDGKSPMGLYRLGRLFAYSLPVDTRMPVTQTGPEDKWIDDPESDLYNTYVHGDTDAKSFELLRRDSDVYKYCMVIEYNTDPVVKGKGSAIFFHLNIGRPTAGCIAIDESAMTSLLSWLDPEKNPHILIWAPEEEPQDK